MNIRVNYSAQIRQAAGVPHEQLEIDGPQPLQEFAHFLVQRSGSTLKSALLDNNNSLRSNIMICVNDEQVGAGDATLLCDGDEVTFMSPISGG